MKKQPYYVKDSDFNEESGISTVTITTKNGDFSGKAKLNENDIKYKSVFAGCQYAEIRACIKYLKFKRHEMQISKKAIENYYETICHGKDFDSHSAAARKARWAIHDYDHKIEEYENRMISLENRISHMAKEREKLVDHFAAKREGKTI